MNQPSTEAMAASTTTTELDEREALLSARGEGLCCALINCKYKKAIVYVNPVDISDNDLTFTARNKTGAPLSMKGGDKPVEIDATEGPSTIYFTFPTSRGYGLLKPSDIAKIRIGGDDWAGKCFKLNQRTYYAVCPKHDLTLQKDQDISFRLTKISTSEDRADIECKRVGIAAKRLAPNREESYQSRLEVQLARRGPKKAKIVVADPSSVLITPEGNPDIENDRVLSIVNRGKHPLGKTWNKEEPRFELHFMWASEDSDIAPRALTTVKRAANHIEVQPPQDGKWSEKKWRDGDPYWELIPSKISNRDILGPDEKVKFSIEKIVTRLKLENPKMPELALGRLCYFDIPGYSDGYYPFFVQKCMPEPTAASLTLCKGQRQRYDQEVPIKWDIYGGKKGELWINNRIELSDIKMGQGRHDAPPPSEVTTTYIIKCIGQSGAEDSKLAVLNFEVPKILTFELTSEKPYPGEELRLSWDTKDGDKCVLFLDGKAIGDFGLRESDVRLFSPHKHGKRKFLLVCKGKRGVPDETETQHAEVQDKSFKKRDILSRFAVLCSDNSGRTSISLWHPKSQKLAPMFNGRKFDSATDCASFTNGSGIGCILWMTQDTVFATDIFMQGARIMRQHNLKRAGDRRSLSAPTSPAEIPGKPRVLFANGKPDQGILAVDLQSESVTSETLVAVFKGYDIGPYTLYRDDGSGGGFFTEKLTIQRIRSDQSVEKAVGLESNIRAFGVDTINRKLYWVDSEERLYRADFQGKGQKELCRANLGDAIPASPPKCFGLVVEPFSGDILWVEPDGKRTVCICRYVQAWGRKVLYRSLSFGTSLHPTISGFVANIHYSIPVGDDLIITLGDSVALKADNGKYLAGSRPHTPSRLSPIRARSDSTTGTETSYPVFRFDRIVPWANSVGSRDSNLKWRVRLSVRSRLDEPNGRGVQDKTLDDDRSSGYLTLYRGDRRDFGLEIVGKKVALLFSADEKGQLQYYARNNYNHIERSPDVRRSDSRAQFAIEWLARRD